MPSRSRGLVASAVVFVVAFPWVNSEWKGSWLQAVGGAALVAVPAGLGAWGWADRSRRGTILLRVLLVAVVLASLAGIHSYGAFTTPFLLAPLWLAARRERGAAAYLWVLLVTPCALVTGWLLASSFDGGPSYLPAGFTTLVVLLFIWSAAGAAPVRAGSQRR